MLSIDRTRTCGPSCVLVKHVPCQRTSPQTHLAPAQGRQRESASHKPHPPQPGTLQVVKKGISSRIQRCSKVGALTEAIVHEKVERMPVAGDGELALGIVQLLKAFYGDGVEVACGVSWKSCKRQLSGLGLPPVTGDPYAQ